MRTFRILREKFPHIFFILAILDFIWELPQNIVGMFMLVPFHHSEEVPCCDGRAYRIFSWNSTAGISLGWFQFTSGSASKNTCSHEVGHSVQSLYLGPLYLIAVGIPSIVWAWSHNRFFPEKDYYSIYPENWADKLGCVHR